MAAGVGEAIGLVFQFISRVISDVSQSKLIEAARKKQQEIATKVGKAESDYFNMVADETTRAMLMQYSEKIEEEKKAMILRGNLITVGIVVFALSMFIFLYFLLRSGGK